MNGRGEKHLVKDEHNITGYATTPEPTVTPLEVFNVDHGKTYRFRMISAAPKCFFKVSVDDHDLIVIATDGAPLKPVPVQSIMIHPGTIRSISVVYFGAFIYGKKDTSPREATPSKMV